MAARATRSRSGAASSSDDASHCLLLALSHDELGVIVDGLADPLQPVVAVAFSSTCLGLRTPLQAALEVLKERHAKAKALCRKVGTSCACLVDTATVPDCFRKGLVADDMATLGMLLKWLPRLHKLILDANYFEDAGMEALCEGLGPGSCPSLSTLTFVGVNFGPLGAEALAAALRRGAMPTLEVLCLGYNPIGNQGVASLAAPLRKLPLLTTLYVSHCEIGDVGMASLVDNLGKDDFKALNHLWMHSNKITDAGVARLLAALDAGGMPKLVVNDPCLLVANPASAVAVEAVKAALVKRSNRAGHTF